MLNTTECLGFDTKGLHANAADAGVKQRRCTVQAQDARVVGYNTAPAQATIYNPLDMRQGYVGLRHQGAWR